MCDPHMDYLTHRSWCLQLACAVRRIKHLEHQIADDGFTFSTWKKPPNANFHHLREKYLLDLDAVRAFLKDGGYILSEIDVCRLDPRRHIYLTVAALRDFTLYADEDGVDADPAFEEDQHDYIDDPTHDEDEEYYDHADYRGNLFDTIPEFIDGRRINSINTWRHEVRNVSDTTDDSACTSASIDTQIHHNIDNPILDDDHQGASHAFYDEAAYDDYYETSESESEVSEIDDAMYYHTTNASPKNNATETGHAAQDCQNHSVEYDNSQNYIDSEEITPSPEPAYVAPPWSYHKRDHPRTPLHQILTRALAGGSSSSNPLTPSVSSNDTCVHHILASSPTPSNEEFNDGDNSEDQEDCEPEPEPESEPEPEAEPENYEDNGSMPSETPEEEDEQQLESIVFVQWPLVWDTITNYLPNTLLPEIQEFLTHVRAKCHRYERYYLLIRRDGNANANVTMTASAAEPDAPWPRHQPQQQQQKENKTTAHMANSKKPMARPLDRKEIQATTTRQERLAQFAEMNGRQQLRSFFGF